MLASASPCSCGCGAAFGLHGDAGLLGVGDVLDALTLDLGAFEDGGDELLLVTEDFGLLHLDLLLLLDLLHFHLFGDDLLLHDVGLKLVGLVGLGLLTTRGSVNCAFWISRSRCASACLARDAVSARTRSWSAEALATAASLRAMRGGWRCRVRLRRQRSRRRA